MIEGGIKLLMLQLALALSSRFGGWLQGYL